MLDKVSQMAEQAATNVSRREFLGRLGGVAMGLAATVGGILAMPAIGDAAKPPPPLCTGGDSQCIGMPVGTPCGSREFVGRCKQVKKSTECSCG